ncbi:hypothetical protein B0T25DRAFT_451644, partial [Lasiosphaeria hispida]
KLFHLYPGDTCNPLIFEVRLEVFPLEQASPFEALSHAWGDKTKADGVRVHAHAMENLITSLMHLRHPDRERIVWADALYINQGDIGKRSEQVGIMGHIYARRRQGLDMAWPCRL